MNFGGSREELELQYGHPWSEFSENAIPRKQLLQHIDSV
jgi:hypothetical protein